MSLKGGEAGVQFSRRFKAAAPGSAHRKLLPSPCRACSSGTTGDPKGAMHTHATFVADVAAAHYCALGLTAEDVHLSYLPLAHGG